MRSVVHKSFEQINETGKVRLFKSHKKGFADGEQLRDFVYGVDVAKACVEMLESAEGSYQGFITWAQVRRGLLKTW